MTVSTIWFKFPWASFRENKTVIVPKAKNILAIMNLKLQFSGEQKW